MNFEKIVSIITKVGAVVLTTVGSFVITPPVIDPEIEVVNWHNLFVFAAGILGVIFYSRFKSEQKQNHKRIGIGLIIVLVILVGLYELTYYKFSRECFEEVRTIVGSKNTILSSVLSDYKKWEDQLDPIKSLVEAYQCEPQRVWPITWLLIPYWGILILYLLITALVTFSISFISSVLTNTKEV